MLRFFITFFCKKKDNCTQGSSVPEAGLQGERYSGHKVLTVTR